MKAPERGARSSRKDQAMHQAVLVQHAALRHYRPGEEDTTLRVVSSASSDAGTYDVIHEPQGDPAAFQVQSAGAAARLRGRLRPAAAVLSVAARGWATGSRRPVAAAEAGEPPV
jgi:hypothetical protein